MKDDVREKVVDARFGIDLGFSLLSLFEWNKSARNALDNQVFGQEEISI